VRLDDVPWSTTSPQIHRLRAPQPCLRKLRRHSWRSYRPGVHPQNTSARAVPVALLTLAARLLGLSGHPCRRLDACLARLTRFGVQSRSHTLACLVCLTLLARECRHENSSLRSSVNGRFGPSIVPSRFGRDGRSKSLPSAVGVTKPSRAASCAPPTVLFLCAWGCATSPALAGNGPDSRPDPHIRSVA